MLNDFFFLYKKNVEFNLDSCNLYFNDPSIYKNVRGNYTIIFIFNFIFGFASKKDYYTSLSGKLYRGPGVILFINIVIRNT